MILDLLVVIISLIMIFIGLGFLATLLLVNVRLPFYKMDDGSKEFKEVNAKYENLMERLELKPKGRLIISVILGLVAFLMIYGGSFLVSGLM